MKRLIILGALLALVVVVAVCFFRPSHPKLQAELPAKEDRVVRYDGKVKTPPLKPGDPVIVEMTRPESKWKSIVIVPSSRDMMLDVGLGYEVIKVDPPILPPIGLDAIATPARYGVGLSTPLTEHVDLEAGVSRRWDLQEVDRYIGFGFHLAF